SKGLAGPVKTDPQRPERSSEPRLIFRQLQHRAYPSIVLINRGWNIAFPSVTEQKDVSRLLCLRIGQNPFAHLVVNAILVIALDSLFVECDEGILRIGSGYFHYWHGGPPFSRKRL